MRPATPASTMIPLSDVAPATPITRARLDTSPSFAPKTIGRRTLFAFVSWGAEASGSDRSSTVALRITTVHPSPRDAGPVRRRGRSRSEPDATGSGVVEPRAGPPDSGRPMPPIGPIGRATGQAAALNPDHRIAAVRRTHRSRSSELDSCVARTEPTRIRVSPGPNRVDSVRGTHERIDLDAKRCVARTSAGPQPRPAHQPEASTISGRMNAAASRTPSSAGCHSSSFSIDRTSS